MIFWRSHNSVEILHIYSEYYLRHIEPNILKHLFICLVDFGLHLPFLPFSFDVIFTKVVLQAVLLPTPPTC